MTQLAISTSPRMTWLWAPDEAAVQRVKLLLGDACWPARRGRDQLSLVLDVGIGVDAMTACETLAANDFTFAWHESVHPWDRTGWPTNLPGMTAMHDDRQLADTHPSTAESSPDAGGRSEPDSPDPGGVDLGDGVRLGPDHCRPENDEVTAHWRRIYRGDADIGGVDYDSCPACRCVRLGEIGLFEVEQGRGIGKRVLAQLRAELPGYHWGITPEKKASRPFWKRMRETYPGEYLVGDSRVLQCPHFLW
jgi:hypothetical protein